MDEWEAALRLSDRVTTHLLADREGNRGRWIAARLSDGGADPDTVYDTREHAIAAVLHSAYYTYVRLPWMAMAPREAWHFMAVSRNVFARYQQRFDVEGQHVILPARAELAAHIAPHIFLEGHR